MKKYNRYTEVAIPNQGIVFLKDGEGILPQNIIVELNRSHDKAMELREKLLEIHDAVTLYRSYSKLYKSLARKYRKKAQELNEK